MASMMGDACPSCGEFVAFHLQPTHICATEEMDLGEEAQETYSSLFHFTGGGLGKYAKLVTSFLQLNPDSAHTGAMAMQNPASAIACHGVATNLLRLLGTGEPLLASNPDPVTRLVFALGMGSTVIHVKYQYGTEDGHSFVLIARSDGVVEVLEAWAGIPPQLLTGKLMRKEDAVEAARKLRHANVTHRYDGLQVLSTALRDAATAEDKALRMHQAFADGGNVANVRLTVTVKQLKPLITARVDVQANIQTTVQWMKRSKSGADLMS